MSSKMKISMRNLQWKSEKSSIKSKHKEKSTRESPLNEIPIESYKNQGVWSCVCVRLNAMSHSCQTGGLTLKFHLFDRHLAGEDFDLLFKSMNGSKKTNFLLHTKKRAKEKLRLAVLSLFLSKRKRSSERSRSENTNFEACLLWYIKCAAASNAGSVGLEEATAVESGN